MCEKIKCKKAKFWFNNNIIYCEFVPNVCKVEFCEQFLEDYLQAIETLSKGRYFPLIIDLRRLNRDNAYKVIKILAKNSKIKAAILSKAYVVSSLYLQFSLFVYRFLLNSSIPNRIFKNYNRAIDYSLRTNNIFNA